MSTSGEYYKIRIGDSFYLTTDNTAGGIPCYLEVPGAENFHTNIVGSVIDTVGGRVVQYVPFTRDKDFEIKVSVMKAADWTYLKNLRETLLIANDSVGITGTGTPGDFTVNAKPRPDEMFAYERFDDEYLFNVVMKFYTI